MAACETDYIYCKNLIMDLQMKRKMTSSPVNRNAKKTSKEVWTNDLERMFIELFRKKENLWSVKSPYYKNRHFRRISFMDICQDLTMDYPMFESEFTPDKLQKKFTNLKTIFRRNLEKMKNSSNGAAYDSSTITWVHFNSLMFLADNDDVEDTVYNYDDSISLNQSLDGDPITEPIVILETRSMDSNEQPSSSFITASGDIQEPASPEDLISSDPKVKPIVILEPRSMNIKEQPSSSFIPSSGDIQEPASLENVTPIDINNIKKEPGVQSTVCLNPRKEPPKEVNISNKLLAEARSQLKNIPLTQKTTLEDACGQYVAQILKSIPDVKKRRIAQKKIIKTAFKCLLE